MNIRQKTARQRMNPVFENSINEISDWIVESALTAVDYSEIYSGFCDRLLNAGIPVWRINISMRTLHPMTEALSMVWVEGAPLDLRMHGRGSGVSEAWSRSPLKVMLDQRETEIRFRESGLPNARARFPLIDELMDEGMTDYHGFTLSFSDQDAPFENRDGLIASFASRSPEGFQPHHTQALRRLLPRFGLVAKLANRERLFSNVLDAYLGPDAGAHVRGGQIALGTGQLIDAVIWFSDLRNSTALAEELGHTAFVDLLNDYFSALAGSVLEHDGQVLRFIGDAALAIFPIGENGFLPNEARAAAERAAQTAIRKASEINTQRVSEGKVQFDFGIGLHVGRIMYGNIGVPTRVEFSVVGAAANEAAKMESMCKGLKETVLASEQFIGQSSLRWRDIGVHPIGGSKTDRRLFAPEFSAL